MTEGDIELFRVVYECRLVTIDHLIALTGRSRRKLSSRLVKLTKRHYLYRKRFPYQKYIYTLNRAAVPLLVERGLASKELVDQRVRLGELTELFLKHSLMVVDVHVALELAGRTSPIQLVAWKQGQELIDSVTVREDGKRIVLPVRPDAFFTLEDTTRPAGQNRAHFFLEADRSTTTSKRFQRKIKGYHHYFEQGLHTKKYGMKGARVVTLTLTEARAENLCEAVSEALPQQMGRFFYYFAPVSRFSLANPSPVLSDIFLSPRDYKEGVRHRLIQPLAPESSPSQR